VREGPKEREGVDQVMETQRFNLGHNYRIHSQTKLKEMSHFEGKGVGGLKL